MRTAIHANSIAAFHAEEARLSKRAEAVLKWITKHGPHTDREVMAGMGFPDMNNVRPRITELVKAGRLMEVGDVVCPLTRKSVRCVDIRRARQLSLIANG